MRTSGAGLGLAVLSAATFGTSGTFGSALMSAGWSPGGAVLTRIGVAALLLTVPAVLQLRGRWHALPRSLPAVTGYGLVAVTGCQLCYFEAVEHLSVGVALLLEYSGTLLVVGWMWLRHGRRPGPLTTAGGLLVLVGLVLVLDLTGSQRVDAVGVLWGLGAATGSACFFVLSAHTEETVAPIVMAWAGMTVGAAALLLLGLLRAVPLHATATATEFAGHRTSWVVPVIGLSLVAAVIAYTSGIGAARRLGARLASFVGIAEVLFAALFAWGFLGQRPATLQCVGGVLVLGGIALVRLGEDAPEPVEESELATAL